MCSRFEIHWAKPESGNLLPDPAVKFFSDIIMPFFFFFSHPVTSQVYRFETHLQPYLTFCPFLTEDWALCSLFPELPWIFIHCLHLYKLESSKMNESSESEKTHSVMRAKIYYLISILNLMTQRRRQSTSISVNSLMLSSMALWILALLDVGVMWFIPRKNMHYKFICVSMHEKEGI